MVALIRVKHWAGKARHDSSTLWRAPVRNSQQCFGNCGSLYSVQRLPGGGRTYQKQSCPWIRLPTARQTLLRKLVRSLRSCGYRARCGARVVEHSNADPFSESEIGSGFRAFGTMSIRVFDRLARNLEFQRDLFRTLPGPGAPSSAPIDFTHPRRKPSISLTTATRH